MSVCHDMDIDVGVGGACVCYEYWQREWCVILVILVINAKAQAKDDDGTVLMLMPKVWLMRPCFGYVQVIRKHLMTHPTQWDSVLRLLVRGLIIVEPAPR